MDDAGELLQRKTNLTRKLTSANEVTASLAKASGDVKSHLATKKSEKHRAAKRQKDDEEQGAVKKARDEATAAAAAIKKKKDDETQKTKGIFLMALPEVPAMPVCTGTALLQIGRGRPFARRLRFSTCGRAT